MSQASTGYLVVLLMRSLSACSLAKNVLYSTTQNVQGKKWDGKRRDENSYAWRGDYIYRKDQAVFGDFSVIISSFLSSKLCVTLFLLLPWKMFSPSSILSVAQQLLATFPRFYSWQFILSTFYTIQRNLQLHLAVCKGISDSTQWVWCWKHSTHWRHWSVEPHGCAGCCLSAYYVDFFLHTNHPCNIQAFFLSQVNSTLLLKDGRRGRPGSQYLLLRHVKEEKDFTMTSVLNSASATALKEGL